MIPKYTGEWNRGDVYKGDTIKEFTITLLGRFDRKPVTPVSVCCQLKDRNGNILHTYAPVINGARVTFPRIDGEDTRDFNIGVCVFDVEYTLPDGVVRTYLKGKQRILEDVSRCQ